MREPIDYRTQFPAWFTGGYDPSYPSWADLFNDPDDLDNTAALVAHEMDKIERKVPKARRSGVDWFEHVEGIQSLIDRCRAIYFPAYLDWLARNAPMGSRWRPHERLSRNHANQPDGPDYTEMSGLGWDRVPPMIAPPWPVLYEEDHMKPLADSGNRQPKDGIILYGLGNFSDRPVGIKPMRQVFHLINRFWREELGLPFRPNFGDDKVLTLPGTYDNMPIGAETRAQALRVNVDALNPAARFLCLALQEIDCHFGPRLSGLVARDQYRHATTT